MCSAGRGLWVGTRIETEMRVPMDVQSALELALCMTSHELRQRCEVVTDYQPTPAVIRVEVPRAGRRR